MLSRLEQGAEKTQLQRKQTQKYYYTHELPYVLNKLYIIKLEKTSTKFVSKYKKPINKMTQKTKKIYDFFVNVVFECVV